MKNKVNLLGYVCESPELKYMENGSAVTNIILVTTRRWRNKQTGEKENVSEIHRVIFYNKLAEIVGKNVKKGGLLDVEGRIQSRKWQDESGNDRYATEIIANEMQMLDKTTPSFVPPKSGGYTNPDQDAQQMGNVDIPAQDFYDE